MCELKHMTNSSSSTNPLASVTKNYWVKNKTATNPTSPEMTVGTLLVENVSNEVYAVIEAEKIWKACGYLFHPEMSVAKETQDCLPIF